VANYANGSAGSISQYLLGSGGALTPMTISSVAAGKGPAWIAVDRTGHYAYVVNIKDNTISQFAVGAVGALTPLSTPTVTAGTSPYVIAITY
jgi:DNA-binding beta-propeller fold protein YncE